ncbi:lysophospholipid acyltransferase family protein [Limnobacter sp.]|uniref:lysophospholipid acyltransferase family protein n=1 Tax=Limnobacter sp. TaxID=2003368 RepID=UPI0025C69D18|nr:lysophospholipid acyltransferase family protein [Limnobacter sp.]
MNGWHYKPFTKQQKQRIGQRMNRWYAAWNWLIEPEFEGLEHIPTEGPVLLVGNHSIMAFADGSLMMREIYRQHGIVCRSLGLHAHFKVPVWGKLLAANGAVDGTPENCTAMMQAGEHIIVYPGGGGEVMKRKGEQHTLRWKNRTGFARMAIQNNCTIVPFSTVGADDCFDILYDNAEFSQTRIGKALIKATGVKEEEFPPMLKGVGPTLIPKPQKMYFKFHPPINVADFQHKNMDKASLALRNAVEATVQGGIDELLVRRHTDPESVFTTRLMNKAKRLLQRNRGA